jgi:hypothetical protein
MPLLRDKAKRNALRAALYERLASNGVPLAEAVQTLRKILAKDQAQFSAEVGVSLSSLRKVEQEGGSISLATARRILDRFGLELVVRVKPKG